jgi:hypothetical protein
MRDFESNAETFLAIAAAELTGGGDRPAHTAGFKIQVGESVIEFMRDERSPLYIIIDASVLSLNLTGVESRHAALKALHVINHAARGESDWLLTIDAQDTLLLTTRQKVTHLQRNSIRSFLGSIVEVSREAKALWQSADHAVDHSVQQDELSQSRPHSYFIKG